MKGKVYQRMLGREDQALPWNVEVSPTRTFHIPPSLHFPAASPLFSLSHTLLAILSPSHPSINRLKLSPSLALAPPPTVRIIRIGL